MNNGKIMNSFAEAILDISDGVVVLDYVEFRKKQFLPYKTRVGTPIA